MYRTRFLLLALLLATGACEPRLPLAYLRQAVAPEGALAEAETVPRLGLTDSLPQPVAADWDSIQARDTLRALLTFNSTGYFIHRGEPMGFEYDLLQAFAEAHDLTLETIVARDRAELFRMLNRGVGDLVAARLVAEEDYRRHVRLTRPLYATRPVIVQRASSADAAAAEQAAVAADTASPAGPTPPDTVRADVPTGAREVRARLLRRPSELGGEAVHVPSGSDYYDRIVELSDSLGEQIELVEVENADQVEPLIEAVAQGQIRLTVSSENLAELSQARFENLVVTPVVGPTRPVVWAVRENAPELERQLNEWLRSEQADTILPPLYRKYYVDRSGYQERVEDQYLTSETGRISEYDSLLARHASGLGWDWRLLAAQVAQESRFDPAARSWAGAEGLLQLMPRTAREMGVTNARDPESNVAGGVRYLAWLSDLWDDEIADPEERRKFILASYNAGRGHVLDAQRLAEKHGDDPDSWEDVAYWLLQKSKPEIYGQDVVQHGYVRGMEPVQYVSKILKRYDSYRDVRAP